jgi:DNA-binding MarR family transcriptional regulator
MAKAAETERDSVDRYLESWGEQLPELDLEVEGIVDRTMSLSRAFRRLMDETLADFGLMFGEWGDLAHLKRIGPPHRRSPGQLAEHAGLSSGAMTSRLDRLEQAGYVRRLPDPADRRGIQVELTEEGHRVVAASIGAQHAKESLVASALDPEERAQLNALLRRLMIAFARSGVAAKEKAAT